MSSRNIVILDTNVIVQSFWMNSGAFLILLENIKIAADDLIIPEVVFDESISQFEKKFNEQLEKIVTPIGKIEQQLNIGFNILEKLDFDKKMGEYRDYLEDMIAGHSIIKLEYPEVPHSLIARKYMKREKPFNNKGEGYCDALIWENVVGLLENDGCESVTLITSNSKDFCEGKELHPELYKELEQRGISPDKIQIYTSLKEFNEDKIMPKLELSESLKAQINENRFDDFNLSDWLEDKLFDLLNDNSRMLSYMFLKTTIGDFHLSEVYDVSNISALNVRYINANTRYVDLEADLFITAEICADWQEYKTNEIIKHLFDENKELPTPYACVSISDSIRVKLALIVEGDAIEKSKIEIMAIIKSNHS